MAGHSHWANIKRQKGKTDAKRGKIWSKIARKIIVAAKNGGDSRENLSLRYVVDEAKAANMPRLTIENAIKKGTGELGAENYEDVTYEGYGPNGVAIIVEGLTNNRARTAHPNCEKFSKWPAAISPPAARSHSSSTSAASSRSRPKPSTKDKLMELALDAGAEDVTSPGEVYEVLTSPVAFMKVKDAIAAAGIAIEDSTITHLPANTVAVDAELGARILKLVDQLEDNDDVQSVSHNAEMPESAGV